MTKDVAESDAKLMGYTYKICYNKQIGYCELIEGGI